MTHRWPTRDFHQPADRTGCTTEPRGFNEAGEPLYEFYDSHSLEKRVLTEAEVMEELARLAKVMT